MIRHRLVVLSRSGSRRFLKQRMWTCGSSGFCPISVATTSASSSAGMAKKQGGASARKSKNFQKNKKFAGKGKDKLKCVDEWNHLAKKLLKAYPNFGGSMVKTQGASVKKFFRKDGFKDEITADTSELVARPPMGVNLTCATVELGIEALVAIADEPETTGIPQCQALFKDDMLEAAKLLQANKSTDKGALTAMAKKFFAALGDDDTADEKLTALALLADTSSRLWGMAIRVSELIKLTVNKKAWAKQVPDTDKQHPAIKKWCKDPTSDKLASGIADAFVELFHWGGKQKGKKKLGANSSSSKADSSDDDADSSAKSSDSSDSSKKKKKDKKQKSKKAQTKGKKSKRGKSSSESSSSSAPPAKKQKQDKKEKRDELAAENEKMKEILSAMAASKQDAEDKEKEAANCTWKQGDVQEFLADAMKLKESIGDLDGGIMPTSEFEKLVEMIPPMVISTRLCLKDRLAEIKDKTEISNKVAKALAIAFVGLGNDVEKFYERQSSGAAASAGNAGAK